MSARPRGLSIMAIAASALGGCEWIAGIRDTTVSADGGVILEDGGNAIRPDARPGVPPDAAVPAGCPEPCLFDAVADFAYDQGGTNGTWIYVEEALAGLGATYDEMSLGDREGTMAWVGTPLSPVAVPALVHCPSSPGYPGCDGVEDKLLFETSEPGANHPGLAWMASQDVVTTIRLSGDWRVPPSAPTDAPMTLLLVRNSTFDSLLEERFLTRTIPAAFDFEIDVAPGDILRLIAVAGDSARAPLALSFYISEAQNPGRCQMATPFQDDPTTPTILFANLCDAYPFHDEADSDSTCLAPAPRCPPTTDTEPPIVLRGRGRVFVEGASARYLGSPNRYTGDWTVQFWAYLDNEGSWTNETLLADHDCETERGVRVTRYSLGDGMSEMIFAAYHDDPQFDRCATGPASISAMLTNNQWHFIRFTRSTARETLSVCIDGVYAGHRVVPGDVDMSATERMWLGRAVTYEPAYFRGRLADLRVLEAALPCSEPEP